MQMASVYACNKNYPNKDEMVQTRMRSNHLTQQQAIPLVERGTFVKDDGYYWRYDLKVTQPAKIPFIETDIYKIFSQVTCPVLIIMGTKGLFKTT